MAPDGHLRSGRPTVPRGQPLQQGARAGMSISTSWLPRFFALYLMNSRRPAPQRKRQEHDLASRLRAQSGQLPGIIENIRMDSTARPP